MMGIESANRLLDLARKESGPISPAEEKLLRSVAMGAIADYSADSEKENDPTNAQNWSINRVLTAKRIAWLCTNPSVSPFVMTHRGVFIKGARIDGVLDCMRAKVQFPLTFLQCCFQDQINLISATIEGLHFIASHTKGIDARGVKIEGSLFLRHGFKADGEVSLIGASIEGSLDCEGDQFSNKHGSAICADGIKVRDAVFLRGGFKSEGEVRLIGAKIGGQMVCANAQFISSTDGDLALNANECQVEMAVNLSPGFRAEGEVNFVGATIGSSLNCKGGQFYGKNGDAIAADALNVGSVFLCGHFKAQGRISFVSAAVREHFVWQEISAGSDATLDLRSAKVGTLRDDEKSWPKPDKLLLQGFVYDEIGSDAPTDA